MSGTNATVVQSQADEQEVGVTSMASRERTEEVFVSEDYISKVFYGDGCTLPSDFLEFEYSYGYDCNRSMNLCVADENTVIFPSGNIIHILNVLTREVKFRRSAGGGGIGHITKNPQWPHLTVGECGVGAQLIIYQWPTWEIYRILKTGTAGSNARLFYSPDGTLLCSHGGSPDYKLTIWDWEKSERIFETKANGRNVINSLFSAYVPGHFVSSGRGYIQFWKIAKTCTGHKLTEELGRFGKTQSSNIIGLLPMPDEKVVSGCEWGNILLWKDGLIKVEVSRRNNKPCHTAPISQFEFYDGELITVGLYYDNHSNNSWTRYKEWNTCTYTRNGLDERVVKLLPRNVLKFKEQLRQYQVRK